MKEYTHRRKQQEKAGIGQRVLSIVGVVLCVIFGFLLLCNLTIIIKGSINPEQPPSVFGVTPMAVLSGSMSGNAEDHIEVGDLIFVGKAEPDKLKTGDIIAFMEGETAVAHRIVAVQSGEDGSLQWITKGDANNVEDQNPVSEENLIGVYRWRIPKAGDFALFLQKPLGMILFIGVPLFAFIIYDIIRRQMAANREKKKTAELEAELTRLREIGGQNAELKETASERKQPSLKD